MPHRAQALPRSNQTEATLFDEGRNDTNGELLMKRILLGAVALVPHSDLETIEAGPLGPVGRQWIEGAPGER